MKKISLTEAQLYKISKSRETNVSWYQIGKDVGVDRRVAQREYENWIKDKKAQDLRDIRKTVIAQAFTDHVTQLLTFAECLVAGLPTPPSIGELKSANKSKSAEEAIDEAIGKCMGNSDKYSIQDPVPSNGNEELDKKRRRRQGYKLLESLKEHTKDHVEWNKLDSWKKAWDSYIKELIKLKNMTNKELQSFLNQSHKPIKRLKKEDIERLHRAVNDVLWYTMSFEKLIEDQLFHAKRVQAGKFEIEYGIESSTSIVTDKDSAENIVWACNTTVSNLFKTSATDGIRNEITAMETAITDLDESLDILTIKPIILRTNCSICPIPT